MKGRALIQVNLAVFLFGTAGLFAKWLDLPAIAITLGRVVFSSLALGVFALVTRQSLRVKGRDFFLLVLPCLWMAPVVPTISELGMLLFLGVVTTAVAHTLFITSLKVLPAQITGVVSSMESVYGILLAFLVLRETPSFRAIAGAAVIIGVVVLSQLLPGKGKGRAGA